LENSGEAAFFHGLIVDSLRREKYSAFKAAMMAAPCALFFNAPCFECLKKQVRAQNRLQNERSIRRRKPTMKLLVRRAHPPQFHWGGPPAKKTPQQTHLF
jgi:hypothetical protein